MACQWCSPLKGVLVKACLREAKPPSRAQPEANAPAMVCGYNPSNIDYIAGVVCCLDWQAGKVHEVAAVVLKRVTTHACNTVTATHLA